MTVDDSTKGSPPGGGFITLRDMLERGARAGIQSGLKVMDENRLYDKIESLDVEDRLEVLQRLALTLTEEHYHRFVDALVISLFGDTLDVTGWTRIAIKAALIVCAERDLPVSFKNGDRTTSPVSYPKEGPLLEMFVDSIHTGSWG